MRTAVLAASGNPIEWVFGALEHALGGVLAWFYSIIPNYGVAIILLTISVRVLLYPLTAKSTKSMRAMALLQPEIKKLQAKYKNDRQRLNTEMMALYKANKVNPAAGCLPLIVQMPLLFAMFQVIRYRPPKGSKKAIPGFIATNFVPGSSRLWRDLKASNDAVKAGGLAKAQSASLFLGINLGVSPSQALSAGQGVWYVLPHMILVALIVGTGWFQQVQMQRNNPQADAQPQMMKTMTKFFPVFFGLISFSLPAGVNLYFLTSNLAQILQQWVILRRSPAQAVVAPAKAGPPPQGSQGAKGDGRGKAGAKPGARKAPPRLVPPKSKKAQGSAEGGEAGPPAPRKKVVPKKGQPAGNKPTGGNPSPRGGTKRRGNT